MNVPRITYYQAKEMYARAWRSVRPEQLLTRDPKEYPSVLQFNLAQGRKLAELCAECGEVRGTKGRVRFPFPVGHPMFPMIDVKCPLCWLPVERFVRPDDSAIVSER
jgi:hypothetical protein